MLRGRGDPGPAVHRVVSLSPKPAGCRGGDGIEIKDDAAAGDDVLAGDLADIFGIDLDPADSGAASGFQPTGRRVAELRRRGGFSVPEFAGLLRVSASTVYRWEAARGPLALRAGQEDALQVLYREIEKRQTE